VNDFKIRNPRRVGDGARFTLSSNLIAFLVQDSLTIFSGNDDIFKIQRSLSADLVNERFNIRKLDSAPGEGARSNELILPIKNGVLYISNEPAINFLGDVENIQDIQLQNISDLIKNDMDSYDFTNATMHYHNRNVYIALPAEGLTLIRNMKDGYWQPPQTLPMRSYVTYNRTLYGNGQFQPETYTMFTGTSDHVTPTNTGFAVPAKAIFSYMNFGDREQFKFFNEWFYEGYMSTNTTLKVRFLYDLYGCNGISNKTISISDNRNIFCIPPTDAPFGKASLGKKGLGHASGGTVDDALPKVHAILQVAPQDFREMTTEFSSDDIGFQWEILSHGPAVDTSASQSVDIKLP
jgi:hypothetical protein